MWFDAATGGVDLWEIENSHWAGSANPGSHPLGAIPVGIGDFNHDGTSEIMWHDPATGHIDEWLLTNG